MSGDAPGPDLLAQLRLFAGYARAAAAEIAEYRAEIDPSAPKMSVMLAIGTRLHDFYEQIEKMAERYVAEINGEVAAGADSHERLLGRALPVANRAGSLFSEELGGDLKELLRFRHFFRHAYPRKLEWEKLRANIERVARLLPAIERDLETLARRLEGRSGAGAGP